MVRHLGGDREADTYHTVTFYKYKPCGHNIYLFDKILTVCGRDRE